MNDEETQIVADYFDNLVSAANIPVEIGENRINPCKIHFNDIETHESHWMHPMYFQFQNNSQKLIGIRLMEIS